jgi:hypothetical protein
VNKSISRVSTTKQDEVVASLWNFAHDLETMPHDGKSFTFEGEIKTTVNLEAVGKALERIMKAFGYNVVSIQ